jgi:hypothetical protein
LDQFDEGKRSCRRRLAGHNKRRRKTQPDPAVSQAFMMAEGQANGKSSDILTLLSVLSKIQGLGMYPLEKMAAYLKLTEFFSFCGTVSVDLK